MKWVHHWAFLSIWVLGENTTLLWSFCLHHQVSVVPSVSMRAHRKAEWVLLYLKTLMPWATLHDKGKKKRESAPAWVSGGGQATTAPQEPFSGIEGQVHSHGPLDRLGGTVIISVYLWKKRWIQNSSKGTLCFSAFRWPGWATSVTGVSMHQHRKRAVVQEQVCPCLFACL